MGQKGRIPLLKPLFFGGKETHFFESLVSFPPNPLTFLENDQRGCPFGNPDWKDFVFTYSLRVWGRESSTALIWFLWVLVFFLRFIPIVKTRFTLHPQGTYVGQAAVLCKEIILFCGFALLCCAHKTHPLGFGGDVFAYVADSGLFYHFFANSQVFYFHANCISWANLVSKFHFINCCQEE